ncbi:MFS transporter [Streptomyces sp. NPDC055140]
MCCGTSCWSCSATSAGPRSPTPTGRGRDALPAHGPQLRRQGRPGPGRGATHQGTRPDSRSVRPRRQYLLPAVRCRGCGRGLSRRVASSRLLLAIAIAWSVSLGPLLLFPTFATLLLSRLVLGTAEGPTAPVATHAIHKWFPESRRALPGAVVFVGASIGIAVSAPALTFLIEHHGWKSAFWSLAIAGLAWSAAWLLIGREGVPRENSGSGH